MTSLAKSLAGHDVEVQTYRPGLDFHDEGKDLVILSGGGGEGLEIHDEYTPGKLWYEDEMKFIRETNKNILGICMGFEVIARAFGAPITETGQGLIYSRESLQLSKAGKQLVNRMSLSQYEAHSWRVQDLPSDFEVLATSKFGIEMFRHTDDAKSIFATQFHPEKGGTLELDRLINKFIAV
jgi:GMP synthase-like glutamine amidotransferase